jgi:hypothetical protein
VSAKLSRRLVLRNDASTKDLKTSSFLRSYLRTPLGGGFEKEAGELGRELMPRWERSS